MQQAKYNIMFKSRIDLISSKTIIFSKISTIYILSSKNSDIYANLQQIKYVHSPSSLIQK